jgi:hypothetical protein
MTGSMDLRVSNERGARLKREQQQKHARGTFVPRAWQISPNG